MVIAGQNKIKFENSLYNYKNLTTQDFHLNRKGQKTLTPVWHQQNIKKKIL